MPSLYLPDGDLLGELRACDARGRADRKRRARANWRLTYHLRTLPRIAVYLALPKELFGSAHHERFRDAAARRCSPEHELFDPSEQGWTDETWLLHWPIVQAQTRELLLLPHPDRSLPFGCYRETLECMANRVPTFLWWQGRWHDCFALEPFGRGATPRSWGYVAVPNPYGRGCWSPDLPSDHDDSEQRIRASLIDDADDGDE